jgi:hypothetical protein
MHSDEDSSLQRTWEIATTQKFELECFTRANDNDARVDADNIFVNQRCSFNCSRPPEVFELPDGDFHVCFGMACRDVVLGKDQQYVCAVSGLHAGSEHMRENDSSWTGRSTTSGNPDDTAGIPIGGWAKRRDMFSASVHAHQNAAEISDAEVIHKETEKERLGRLGKAAPKRGARCVDELPEASNEKRQRTSKKVADGQAMFERLTVEAGLVIDKLLSVQRSRPPANPESKPQHNLDPRLENLDFVRATALRRYARACASSHSCPSMSAIHDICIASNAFVRERRHAAQQRAKRQRTAAIGRCGFNGKIKNLTANLVVSLWKAACTTPYMMNAKRGADSFRPFVAGVLYALKRGIYLSNGMCVVPEIETITSLLPALRSTRASDQAKQVHSSSHRGLCSLHRAICSAEQLSSEDSVSIREAFSIAARSAAYLRAYVNCNESVT